MLLARFRAIAWFVAAAAVTAHGFQSSPSNRPWPPGLQKVPDDSPPLSPGDALKTFYMPPGYRVELVASPSQEGLARLVRRQQLTGIADQDGSRIPALD